MISMSQNNHKLPKWGFDLLGLWPICHIHVFVIIYQRHLLFFRHETPAINLCITLFRIHSILQQILNIIMTIHHATNPWKPPHFIALVFNFLGLGIWPWT